MLMLGVDMCIVPLVKLLIYIFVLLAIVKAAIIRRPIALLDIPELILLNVFLLGGLAICSVHEWALPLLLVKTACETSEFCKGLPLLIGFDQQDIVVLSLLPLVL